MAEVQDTSQAAEPSMEEILASIRKIISDDAPPAEEAAAESEDVIELTQAVEDDGSVALVEPEPVVLPPEPEPEPMPVAVTPLPEPEPVAPAANLVSDLASTAASSALSTLANTVAIERLALSPMTATSLGNGARTLEDMVIELMRPLLKQWLDENLPATVDRLVQKEIERISRRS